MNILAIDTATEVFSVGISTAAGNFCFEAEAGKSHSELLFDAIDGLTRLARIEREDIDVFACIKGPGSFTGLRIGFAAVKGLALSLGKKIISVPSLDCMAYRFKSFTFLCVPVLDAKQHRFFAAFYRNGERLTDYMDCTAEELARGITEYLGRAAPSEPRIALLCGGGAELAYNAVSGFLSGVNLLSDDSRTGRAPLLLQYIRKSGMLKNSEDERFSAPLYIRKSDAEIKRASALN
ncbi:MAG: tRNA (adenosine(37)-N6)-threonylcarbamoyltransferase complex dimerization subunit type 1 TsaB [Spirochaetaceae bacterium]|jgi:tRNA threonylcarbamoyladenosine biosynthesis protein TsaB|nr:tRNA (adenosine(37)-N6)-threonylcarbamoyltransferase complex dimerization subunit type 1 TsaB [Spirochaetaceae bacterium]